MKIIIVPQASDERWHILQVLELIRSLTGKPIVLLASEEEADGMQLVTKTP